MAEFWRALKTLKALPAELEALPDQAAAVQPQSPAARPPLVHRLQPDEPESGAGPRLAYDLPHPPASARTLHEPPAPWLPNEPETRPGRQVASRPRPERTPSRT